jgi:hypothetical protein
LTVASIFTPLDLVLCSGEPLVELLGLPLEAGEDDEGGDDEDHRPHAVDHHRHVPHIVLQPVKRQETIFYKTLV